MNDLFKDDKLLTTHTIANVLHVDTDSRVFFRRPEDDTIYCVLSPLSIAKLRKHRELDNYLQQQRDSGIVIKIAAA
jgi:hypothetical protein